MNTPPPVTASPGIRSATGSWNWPSRCCEGDLPGAAELRADGGACAGRAAAAAASGDPVRDRGVVGSFRLRRAVQPDPRGVAGGGGGAGCRGGARGTRLGGAAGRRGALGADGDERAAGARWCRSCCATRRRRRWRGPSGGSSRSAGWRARSEVRALDGEMPKGSAQAVVDEATVVLPLAGTIDLDAERTRLTRERDKAAGEAAQAGEEAGQRGFRGARAGGRGGGEPRAAGGVSGGGGAAGGGAAVDRVARRRAMLRSGACYTRPR